VAGATDKIVAPARIIRRSVRIVTSFEMGTIEPEATNSRKISDVEQAVGLASLVCKSAEAVEHFLRFAEQQAHDLLFPRAPIIMSLSIVLRIRRTLTGAEIDNVIATMSAQLALAAERARRRQWQNTVASAAAFNPE
jgi:hypothetical protein